MKTAKLLYVTLERSQAGMFYATSVDEPGLFVAAVSEDEMTLTLPVALRDYFASRGRDVVALPLEPSDPGKRPWAIVSKTLLSDCLMRAA